MIRTQDVLPVLIRTIVAEVTGRSMRMTKEGARLRADLDLRPAEQDRIARLIDDELQVKIRPSDWADWSTVGDLVVFVVVALERERTS